jgi:hypothetical protein
VHCAKSTARFFRLRTGTGDTGGVT